MMDLSDGLARDLGRLCRASSVGALIDPARLPATADVSSSKDSIAHQVAFGEDYELLFSAPPDAEAAIVELAKEHKIRVTCIGTLTDEMKMKLKGRKWPRSRFSHFDAQNQNESMPAAVGQADSTPRSQEWPA